MILLVFLNQYDKNSQLLGKSLPDHLVGDYVKIYTRYDDRVYEKCEVSQTLNKLREYAHVFDKVLISFGLRLFPPSAYKQIIEDYKKTDNNLVFLKKLKGSKTWSIIENQLSFDNCRIADTGLFILLAKDIINSKSDNFNSFLKELIRDKKLAYKFVPFWVFTNKHVVDNKVKGKE